MIDILTTPPPNPEPLPGAAQRQTLRPSAQEGNGARAAAPRRGVRSAGRVISRFAARLVPSLAGRPAAWLGLAPSALTLLLGALATALFGVLAVVLSRGKRPLATTRLPLGSFLSAAALYTLFAGDAIIRWYLRFYGIDR